ncbi:unnamed protein product [Caenorhabditis brenneri]
MKFTICLTILVALLLAVSAHSSKETTNNKDSVADELASHIDFKDSETVNSLLLKSMKKILDRDTRQAPPNAAPAPEPAVKLDDNAFETYSRVVEVRVDKRIKELAERITKLEKLTTSTGYAVSPSGQHNGDGTLVIQLVPGPQETNGGVYPLSQVQPDNSNGNPVALPNTGVNSRLDYNYLYRN